MGAENWYTAPHQEYKKIHIRGPSKILRFLVDFFEKTDFSTFFSPPKSMKNQFFPKNQSKISNFWKDHVYVFFVFLMRCCVPIFSSQLPILVFQILKNFSDFHVRRFLWNSLQLEPLLPGRQWLPDGSHRISADQRVRALLLLPRIGAVYLRMNLQRV